eukprot:CAMPEP_0194281126 /NCGR_PEP_ID=MMETSP0169-20130528/19976_1 /TAXON_ID=218684 /ORGANISM="Corethron pennatum, Strain L29A3" /LENGTH=145 /DNA_ID=CAMNT_0039026095 /DNA_START=179 /DNA_END=613 /DNA_ORIENTATION=+
MSDDDDSSAASSSGSDASHGSLRDAVDSLFSHSYGDCGSVEDVVKRIASAGEAEAGDLLDGTRDVTPPAASLPSPGSLRRAALVRCAVLSLRCARSPPDAAGAAADAEAVCRALLLRLRWRGGKKCRSRFRRGSSPSDVLLYGDD